MEMNWSRWFRCESSFSLLLVPDEPGVFALAEEVMQPSGPQSRRLLAVFEVGDADDLVRALSRLFTPASPWYERLAASRCYVRYAVVADRKERTAAATSLTTWLNSQRDNAAQIFAQSVPAQSVPTQSAPAQSSPARTEPRLRIPVEERREIKTEAEEAVDRVTARSGSAKTVPAG